MDEQGRQRLPHSQPVQRQHTKQGSLFGVPTSPSLKCEWIHTVPWAEAFWSHLPLKLCLAHEGHHAGGHSKWGGVRCGKSLQANDNVPAPFADGLPEILFLGGEKQQLGEATC